MGFGGRLLDGEGAKYLNPPETEIYKKNSVFYAFDQAARSIRKKNRMVLVEGYFDVMRMHACGFTETVACCGTSLTEEHLKKIRRLRVGKTVLLFDGDAAGNKAALKSAILGLMHDVDGFVCLLPEQCDPDDFLRRRSAEAMEKLLNNGTEFARYVIEDTLKRSKQAGLEEKATLLGELTKIGGQVQGKLKRELWFNLVARSFNVSPDAIQTSKNASKTLSSAEIPETENDPLELYRNEEAKFRYEFKIARLMVNRPYFISIAKRHAAPESFSSLVIRPLIRKLFNLERVECESITAEDLCEAFPENGNLTFYLLNSSSRDFVEILGEKDFGSLLYGFLKKKLFEDRKADLANLQETEIKRQIAYWNEEILRLEALNTTESH